MLMATTTAFARAPQQARSTETTRRLLEAAEQLLEHQSFDETSVTDIAARAGVTIGAFYGRFGDKEGLLKVLEAQLVEEFAELADEPTVPARWSGKAIEEVLREHHARLVRIYRSHRGVARALVLRSHTDATLRRRLVRINERNLPRVAQAIARHCRISHPSAERALQFALLAVRSVCRETILFDDGWPGGRTMTDAVLVDELTRMVVAYLGIAPR
jgi:AcrR family transcriptional regulator